jgi:hypothetical protein
MNRHHKFHLAIYILTIHTRWTINEIDCFNVLCVYDNISNNKGMAVEATVSTVALLVKLQDS